MARVCLLVCLAGLLLEIHEVVAAITKENTEPVFVSQQTAHMVLLRKRRYNSGKAEELFSKDNLERECIEEICTMEEAREVFENDEKTMEFWAGYIDGDQCKPPPCQNGGVCEDGLSNYVCWCPPNFSGKNCDIEVTKQCSVNNGGCSHFCAMQADRVVCQCAAGYTLGSDKKSCEPTVQFSCGHMNQPSSPVTGSIVKPRSSNYSVTNITLNTNSEDYNYDEDIPYIFDDYNHPMNDSNTFSTNRHKRSVNETSTEKKQMPSWANPTLPSITAQNNSDQRIVGGDEAIRGEIPWQVALMSHSVTLQRALPFCGGSLLNESWVITAAHCLFNLDGTKRNFFVRVGEHDVNQDEGTERDHRVAEQHIHHMYDFKKSQYNHDIALLKLATPVELSNERRPICLGPKDFIQNLVREASTSLVSGWGQLRFLGPEATKLQKLEIPYVDRTLCKQSSQDHITRYMFCAGFENESKDSCKGDSGGPHATEYKGTWFLTGIVSWGEDCAKKGKYGIYTRVSRYYPWISHKTGIQISS